MTSSPSPKAVSADPANARRRHSHSGRIGSAARRSASRAAAAATMARAKTAMLGGDSQGQATPPCSRPKTSAPAATSTATAPATSIRCRVLATCSCRKRAIIAIATAPSGRLIRKIHRHEAYWASNPPTVGPNTAEIPHTLDSQPWTRPRSFSSYRSPASVLTVAMIAPAPTPCRPRKQIRLTMSHDDAHNAEPARKMTVPMIRIGSRPHWSASLP
jgi:hypothetical protein